MIVTVIISCKHKAGKKKIHSLHFKWMNLFWCVNLCRGSSKLLSSHNAQPEQELQSPVAFFCKAGCKQKADSSTGLERQFPLPHSTVWENGQDIWMISVKSHLYLFTSVIHVCMSVSMWLLSQTFTLELYQETLWQNAPTWN